MVMNDLHELPQTRDRLSMIYAEHCRIDKEEQAIALHTDTGLTPVPCAGLNMLMLGPGTSLTHAAIKTLAENDCLVVWTGEKGIRYYAHATGGTRSSRNLLHQARLATRKSTRIQVVRRMYEMRFNEKTPSELTIEQLRGREGARMRDTYAAISNQTGIKWHGRSYNRADWSDTDPINQALSCANACLYGICHAAIISSGYSPAIGFIHTGKQLSFVYDIADLYKTQTSIPAAFLAVAQHTNDFPIPEHKTITLEQRVRYQCRNQFYENDLLTKIIKDIYYAMDVAPATDDAMLDEDPDYDTDSAMPGPLWDPDSGTAKGGKNYQSPYKDEIR